MNTAVTNLSKKEMSAAWLRRAADYDGIFCFGVRTTGIFCRPSCPSKPKPENMEFFSSAGEAVRAGYRPCKRCRPELANGTPPSWARQLMERAESAPDEKFTSQDIRSLGITPEKARRWFQKNHGMTFAAWCRGLRLSRAFTQIRAGEPVEDVILGHGFESHSGFRSAFSNTFGTSPGKAAGKACLLVAILETPMGPMLAAVSSDAVCQLEFADRRGLEKSYGEMRRRFKLPVVPGDNRITATLRGQLGEYFEGRRREFTVPISTNGTPFQEKTWKALRQVEYGRTASYAEIARQIDAPKAVRAVARANGTNRIYLIIPFHRIIAKDGSLSGYGGGVWRKRLLLEMEHGQQGLQARIP